MPESTPIGSRQDLAIDTLTSFVLDAEHDFLSVVTVIQAHIDLLRHEMVQNRLPVERVAMLSVSVARLVQNVTALAAVSEQTRQGRPNQRVVLSPMMDEIEAETRSAFSDGQALLSLNVVGGTTVMADPVVLKTMVLQMVLMVLQECHIGETVRVVALTEKRRVALSFAVGLEARLGPFKRWRLGSLRLIAANGEGIGLAAIEAMARLQHGHLSISAAANNRAGYRLVLGC